MTVLPSLYRARAVRVTGRQLQAFVPQVFGDTPIDIDAFLGDLPTASGMGWVFFQGGDPAFPVWASAAYTGGDGPGPGVPSNEVFVGPDTPTDGQVELWYDTNAALEPLVDPGVLKAKVNDVWRNVTGSFAGGGTGTDEVWIGPSAPSDPAIELWYDSDAPSAQSVDRWNSAWGIIAVGTFVPPLAPHISTATADSITYPLTATLITGRRYMVRLQVRAITPLSSVGNVSFYMRDNGVDIRGWLGGGDPYVYTAGAYQGASYSWMFTGDNTSHSFEVRAATSGGTGANIYTDYAHYYLEDMGPISYGQPPAVEPTPPYVAWTPLTPINGWISPGGVTEMSVGIRKIGDIVYLKGSLQVGTTVPTLGAAAFNVPAGYFNSCLTRLPLIAFNSSGVCYPARADLSNGGVFYIQNIGGMTLSSGAFIQLMGVNWPVGTT